MQKKGQAAIEFIMTYGWAILVVLVAIAALAYFGVLSPERFLPEKCTFPPGIACTDFTVSSTGMSLVLQNSLGQDITVATVTDVDGGCSVSPAAALNNGATATYTFTGCTHGSVGSRYASDVTIAYSTASGLNHTRTGDITSRVS